MDGISHIPGEVNPLQACSSERLKTVADLMEVAGRLHLDSLRVSTVFRHRYYQTSATRR